MTYERQELNRAYDDGKEDLAYKIIELIEGYDYAIPNEELIRFLEAEIGYHEENNGMSIAEMLLRMEVTE